MRIQGLIAIGLVLGLTFVLAGCASTGDSSSAESTTSEAAASEPAKPAEKVLNVPKSSPLSKVDLGMNDSDVRRVLGEPANVRGYPTGKNWIPFYFGADTYRFDWLYPGKGKVIFSRTSRFGSAVKVVDVIHDPNQQ